MGRETFIALRARWLGHRIASLFLNPPLEIPEFPRAPVPVDELVRQHRYSASQHVVRRRSPLGRTILRVAAVLMLFTIIGSLTVIVTYIAWHLLREIR
jgi:hypothetical protein